MGRSSGQVSGMRIVIFAEDEWRYPRVEFERVSHAMLVTMEVKEKLKTLIQKPNRLSEAAVCDLNGDGVEKY